MAWERRTKPSRRYYYTVTRHGNRVIKRYAGKASSPVAQLLARRDRLCRAQRRAEREAGREEVAAYCAIEPCIINHHNQVERMFQAVEMAQYEAKPMNNNSGTNNSGNNSTLPSPSAFPTREEFDQLVRQAEAGDARALEQLRHVLRDHPGIWRRVADLSGYVESRLMEQLAGASVVARESLQLQLDEMRADLELETASRLERLLIERVLTSWLDVQVQQIACSEQRESRTQRKFWETSLSRAQRRTPLPRIIPEPPCQASLYRYSFAKKGEPSRVLFANPLGPGRSNLRVRVSRDEGKTWPHGKPVSIGSAAYSCMARLPGNHVGIVYERDNYHRISFSAFPVDWLEQSKPGTPLEHDP